MRYIIIEDEQIAANRLKKLVTEIHWLAFKALEPESIEYPSMKMNSSVGFFR